MSLLAPRGGTSVLVKASDEPWLTAHATSLTAVSPGSRLERKDDGWSRADAPGAAATPWAGLAPCTVDANYRQPGRRSSHAWRRRQGRQKARTRSHDPAT